MNPPFALDESSGLGVSLTLHSQHESFPRMFSVEQSGIRVGFLLADERSDISTKEEVHGLNLFVVCQPV